MISSAAQTRKTENLWARRSTRIALIVGIVAGVLLAFPFVKRIPQDPAYHQFVDQRTMLGIPNALNVLSNLPFLLVGAAGLWAIFRQPSGLGRAFLTREEKAPYVVLFFAVALVTFGSGYYHWHPTNGTLLWDRLPMSVGFMALLAGLIGERIEVRWGTWLLPSLSLLGAASVWYWYHTELIGRGDLRPYAIVQFLPLLLIPMLLWLFPRRYTGGGWFFGVFGLYVVAKLLEAGDASVFRALRIVSGHSLKHCAASVAVGCLVVMLWTRQPAEIAD